MTCEQVQATESTVGRKHCIPFCLYFSRIGFRAPCTPLPAYIAKPPPSQPEPWPTQPVSWRTYANEPGKQNNAEGREEVKKIFWNLWFLDSHHAEGPGHFLGLRDDRGDQGMAGSSGVYRTFVTILWEDAWGQGIWPGDLGPALSPIQV